MSHAPCSRIEAEKIYDEYIQKKQATEQVRLDSLHAGNRYLTYINEKLVVNSAKILAASGQGLTPEELIDLINVIINENVDSCLKEPVLIKVVHNLLARNKELHQTVKSASSLDPKRANQTKEDTQDSMFTKLQNCIVLLNQCNIFEEENFADISSKQLYNMDEVAVDTTKRRGKIICGVDLMKRLFQITPEGDNKMNVHITLALTSRADGE